MKFPRQPMLLLTDLSPCATTNPRLGIESGWDPLHPLRYQHLPKITQPRQHRESSLNRVNQGPRQMGLAGIPPQIHSQSSTPSFEESLFIGTQCEDKAVENFERRTDRSLSNMADAPS